VILLGLMKPPHQKQIQLIDGPLRFTGDLQDTSADVTVFWQDSAGQAAQFLVRQLETGINVALCYTRSMALV